MTEHQRIRISAITAKLALLRSEIHDMERGEQEQSVAEYLRVAHQCLDAVMLDLCRAVGMAAAIRSAP